MAFPVVFITGVMLLFSLAEIKAASNPRISGSSFCYDDPACGPSTWGGICQTGKQQSPIDVEFNPTTLFSPTKFTMDDSYLDNVVYKFYAQNNGHTAEFTLNSNMSDLETNLIICGGHLPSCYKFAQFHFHWGPNNSVGSEHTVNGKQYPLELHLVHYRANYSSFEAAAAADDREALVVMGVFYDIGSKNPHLDSITAVLEQIQNPGASTEFDLPLIIYDLYPKASDFAHYNGSLTTPTCDEKVVWSVFLKPLQISERQMSNFRRLSNAEGNSDFNYRNTQDLNGRTVQFYRSLGFLLSS